MMLLFRLVHWPTWRRHPLQFLLPCLGVAIGVAAVVSIDLGSRSTVSSFRRTMQQLEGRATHQIHPGSTQLDGRLVWSLVEIPDVIAAAPVLEIAALAEEPLRIYGIDPLAEAGIRQLGLEDLQVEEGSNFFTRFLAEPGALVVSAGFLERAGLTESDTLALAVGVHRREARVLAVMPREIDGQKLPDNLALADLATAQELSGRDDVSRIDLILRDGADLESLRSHLPDGVVLEKPGGRAARLSTMLAALNTNLRALSYLALFVSLFLIYNALLLAVLRRRRQVGIVRCLGATRRRVAGAWIIEALCMGTLGSALGCLLGLAASRWTLTRLAATASDLYGYVQADTVEVIPQVLFGAAAVGIVATVLAALWPTLEAVQTPPAQTSQRWQLEQQFERRRARAPWFALPLLLVVMFSLLHDSSSPIWGYVAAIAVAFVGALLSPLIATALLWAVQRARVSTLLVLAGLNLRNSMSRSGVALAALAIALSMSIAMGTMVNSFRAELLQWIDQAVRADVYVSPAAVEVDRTAATIPEELIARLRARPSVAQVDSYRGVEARLGGDETIFAGIETSVYATRSVPAILEGPAPAELIARLGAGQASIAEALMRKHDLHPGDGFELEALGESIQLTVAGVHRDYSSDRGVVLVDRSKFEELLGAREANSVALYLRPSANVDVEVEALQRDLRGEYALLIRSNRTLREQAVVVFDRTFSVADVLERIGIAVAAVGILSALLAMLLERGREFATLRALGLGAHRLRALLWIESLLMAGISWLIALGAGSALSWILLRVINVRSFGWSLPIELPWSVWMWNLLWALLAASVACIAPMVKGGRIPLSLALREDG